jgi:hypothetical protein
VEMSRDRRMNDLVEVAVPFWSGSTRLRICCPTCELTASSKKHARRCDLLTKANPSDDSITRVSKAAAQTQEARGALLNAIGPHDDCITSTEGEKQRNGC